MLNIEKKLDKEFQKLAKHKKCHYCSCSANEIHHLIRRADKLYRYDKRNALPVCRQHHFDIHSNGLKEPQLPFEREDIREYLMKNFICYQQFLELKAKEYGIKYTDKDFERVKPVLSKMETTEKPTVRNNRTVQKPDVRKNRATELYKKVKEFKRKQRKEVYQKKTHLRLV